MPRISSCSTTPRPWSQSLDAGGEVSAWPVLLGWRKVGEHLNFYGAHLGARHAETAGVSGTECSDGGEISVYQGEISGYSSIAPPTPRR